MADYHSATLISFKQELLVFTPLLQEKAHVALSETNKTRFFAWIRQGTWLVSRLRREREKTSESFLSQFLVV